DFVPAVVCDLFVGQRLADRIGIARQQEMRVGVLLRKPQYGGNGHGQAVITTHAIDCYAYGCRGHLGGNPCRARMLRDGITRRSWSSEPCGRDRSRWG